ncbi:TonB-dependent receptor domain-containing protein [Marinoscillum furvescens]|uniref:Iron complex outermembrane receptor protein n=1 Tax=Marinoscillum furvescens DSM 4134 TaxID=1122208 RepID=A0A3D9L3T7_MARFU|nr:TonB-dependent receptor [Marinoscillum furvescens]REE00078.1 iron complex outermembrane receptor protein [Marinoscillum furvescens DSM 4134]
MTHHSLTFAFICMLAACAHGQTTLSGKISDATTGAELAGALIITPDDTTTSNTQGQFEITVKTLPTTLTVTYLGYETYHTSTTDKKLYIPLQPTSLTLNEIMVISGTNPKQLNHTPASVRIISLQMLRRDDPFTITNAMNRTPGVMVHTGTSTTNRITLRGIGSRTPYGTSKVKAYYENIPLTDGSGNSTLEDIDQQLIGRMTITKGPASSTYGAGLGGVIRLDAPTPAPYSTNLTSSYTLGAFGTSRTLLSAQHHQQDFDITATYSDLQSDGFRQNNQLDKKQFGMTARWRKSDRTSFSFLGVFTRLKAFIPSSINEGDFQNAPRKAAFTWASAKGYEAYDKGLFGLTWHQNLPQKWKLENSIFGSFRDAYEPRPFNILDESTQSIGNRTTATRKTDNLSLTIGTELFHDHYQWKTYANEYSENTNGSVQGDQLSDFDEKRQYANLFVEMDWKLSNLLTLTAGSNLNYTYYQLADNLPNEEDLSGTYDFGVVLSPKLGMLYQINEPVTLFANVSHGFSPPTLEETLLPDGAINPEIAPETGWNFETGTRISTPHFQLDAAAYFMPIRNLLVAQRTAEDAYVGVNAGVNHHWGLDLSTNYHWQAGPNYTVNTFLNTSLMRYTFREFEHQDTDYSGNQLTGSPEIIVNPGIELISASGVYGNLNGRYVGAMPITDANDLYTDSYWVSNLKIGYKHSWKALTVDVHGGINNLTDTHYAGMVLINAQGFGGRAPRYYYPANPRNLYAGLRVNWKILGN